MKHAVNGISARPRPFVVIGHQSAIPHYRVPFYQKLKEMAGDEWNFGVVFDPNQQERSNDFCEEVQIDNFGFQTLPTSTGHWCMGRKQFVWQSMGSYVDRASLIITDTQLSNLSYPWYGLTRNPNCRWALWGHASNMNLSDTENSKCFQRFKSHIKRRYVHKADAFFAYTEGQKTELVKNGHCPSKVYVIDNTVDLQRQREIALTQLPDRVAIRAMLGFQKDDKIFVMVGRLLPGRRIEYLIETFNTLVNLNSCAKLIVIGGGNIDFDSSLQSAVGVSFVGSVSDPVILGQYLTAADAYIAPGMIGLGILQPLAHEMPVLGFNLETHGPEIEYLNTKNSTLLPRETPPHLFADFLNSWCENVPVSRNESVFESIAHLTLDNMAKKFDYAVRRTLSLP